MHSLEIMKLQFEEERHTLLCILELFTNIVYELSLKNAWLSPIFFFFFFLGGGGVSITVVKICISCIIINWGKNAFELVGSVLKQSRFLLESGRDSAYLVIR